MAELSQETSPETEFGDRMADLLTGLVRGLVDKPDAVHVEIDEEDDTTALSLYVSPDDLGMVIGKQGRTARSLRTILNAIAGKSHQHIALDVLEDDEDDNADGDDAAE